MKFTFIGLLGMAVIALSGCNDDGIPADTQTRDYSQTITPLPTEPLYPESNPFSASKENLGELLFWDPILSGDQNVACASCHHPDFGWADGRQLSVGSDGIGLGPARSGSEMTPLHSPSILNVAFTGVINAPPHQGLFPVAIFGICAPTHWRSRHQAQSTVKWKC